MRNKLCTGAASMLLFILSATAQNPIIQTSYTPDPAPLIYNDTMYVYTGDDIPGTDFYYMTKWRVFSSSDMVNWTDHGVPIKLESFEWARDRAWAAQCIERNGKFYWYICAQTIDNDMAIGVAVSDRPTGPFKDALGKPLISTGSWSNIDPSPFIDDDGRAYLYWGNNNLYYVELNDDMISCAGDIVEVSQTKESFGGVRKKPNPGGEQPDSEFGRSYEDMFVEGPWIYKRNSQYYLMYAGMSKGGECLSYSISDTPTGPWNYQGKIMTDQPTNSFTNHGGIIDYKNKSYLFYHTGLLPGGGSYGRSTAIEEFSYNADGTIPPIVMTEKGVDPVGTVNPFRRNEAETIAWAENCKTAENDAVGVYVTDVRNGGYLKVRQVDFGATTPQTFTASLAAGLDGGILEVRIDSLNGPKLATIDVSRTGGWTVWKKFVANVEQQVTGVHDLYFTFNSHNVTAGRTLFNFDYWKF